MKIQEEIDRYKEKIKTLQKKKNETIKKDKEIIGDFIIAQSKKDENFKTKIIEAISQNNNDKILNIFKNYIDK
ncbi:hypothetical protein [Campylobacter ureolyticus]|uniref:Uncharacterized protein n=1 Tax=Campylobacter ureolyticus ACS-301-V-Sch3b TaxID=883165 RepID=S3XPQ6_9BACT|nr:hypothetical protein [Campylobacter ureolyticus]EPH07383.1 hypothetical protein HMPREF9309_01604 [Campylobacter ureolyticus ACS-301-V-Sch3b]MCZ6156826.1 hypothetical protein [Campylobacter ureolyticus]